MALWMLMWLQSADSLKRGYQRDCPVREAQPIFCAMQIGKTLREFAAEAAGDRKTSPVTALQNFLQPTRIAWQILRP